MDQRSIAEAKENKNGGEEATQNLKLPYLPDDIIVEILLRSPVRSIGRFRCLSKLFCSLFSDPKFARNQLELTIRRSCNLVSSNNLRLITAYRKLLLVDLDSFRVEREYPLKEDFILSELYDRWCIGSSNGLVCLRGKRDYKKRDDEQVLLYNPTTRESKRVPELPESLRCKREPEYRCYWFGFDALTNDYKVVMLVSCNNDEHKVTVCYVYSLKINSWRKITNLLPYYNEIDVTTARLKGAIHWIARIYGGEDLLMAFDLEKEEFREMPLPDWSDGFEGGTGSLVIDTIKGCLCVVHSIFKMHNTVWMMKEYGIKSSWSKIKISVADYSIKPLCLAKDDEEILPLLDMHLLYTKLKDHTYINEFYSKMKTHTFVESLISPNSYGKHI